MKRRKTLEAPERVSWKSLESYMIETQHPTKSSYMDTQREREKYCTMRCDAIAPQKPFLYNIIFNSFTCMHTV